MELGEFKSYFYNYMDSNILSAEDIYTKNYDFCDSVVYDCYRIYQQSDIGIDVICKLAENMFFSIRRFNPKLCS